MQFYELNTARNCLRVIIQAYGIKEIFIPYYICPTVWQACRAENCRIKFYHIDNDFYPATEFDKNAFILYPNYFGICSTNVIKLSNLYTNLIVDNTHSFFMPPCGIASFYSYRKFFDTADGAKLFINTKIQLPEDDYSYDNAPKNYTDFYNNEIRLNTEPPKFINKKTSEIMSKINFNDEKNRRLQLFYQWDKKLDNSLKIKLSENDIPFVYPYLSEKEFQENILIFRYWSPLPKKFLEYKFYKNLKPIPLKSSPTNNTY